MSLWIVTAVVITGLSWAIAEGLRRWRGARWPDLWLGAAAWTGAVALKFGAAAGVFWLLKKRYGEQLPLPVEMTTSGLLTGIFECGITWLVVRATFLRRAPYERALGFGAGFGLFEAVAVGGLLVVDAYLEPAARGWGQANVLAAGTVVYERIVVLPVHALSCVLIWRAVRGRTVWPLAWSFLLKAGVDALPTEGELPELVLDGLYGAAGVLSMVWLVVIDRRERAMAAGAEPRDGS